MNILGISAYYHDSAACLLRNGEIIAAAQEERFSRKKHDQEFPINAITYCLEEGGVTVDDLDHVAFYDKPLVKFERILYTYLATFPRSLPSFLKAMPIWLRQKLWIPSTIREELGYRGKVLFTEHHQSHAASAFFVSPFEEAAILTVDGVGEWATATYGIGRGSEVKLLKEITFPHSLGLLYSAFTYYLGFKVNSAEYKVMGLAPYGTPRYADLIREHLIRIADDGSFKLNMRYFAFDYGLTMTNRRFHDLFESPPAEPEGELTQRHKDLAASVQAVTEEVVLNMVEALHDDTGLDDLCLAGGVALNCVANGRILRESPFKRLFIQPAAGDAGGAIGAACTVYHQVLGKPRTWTMQHAYLGPAFNDEAIAAFLAQHDIPHQRLSRQELLATTARLLAEQAVVGWFQGRMEWGPRALGNRSILADPRNEENWQRVNLKIKYRESFRPFAPSILREEASEYFELDEESPYMLIVAQVRPDRRVIPAVTHVDGSARVQTVSARDNPLFHDLIRAFADRTGVPVLINTSFNVRGEPIVCTPEDAYRCFRRTEMDYLVMGSFCLAKEAMRPWQEEIDWQEEFALD